MRTRFLLGTAFCVAGPLAAQGSTALYSHWNALSGFEFQRYSFDKGYVVQSASQWSLPIVVVAPLGRGVSLDLTTHYAHSERTDTASQSYSGLTDTQVRLLYMLGRDRAVASLSVNLPTGKHSFSSTQYPIASSMSSNFLSFPVSSLGSGFGVTGGLAYATAAGAWNIGLAGGLRYQSSYRPFTDAGQTLDYNPGLEGRLRVGADRLLGQRGRIMAGLTYSTFSTDQFSGSGGGFQSPWFNPGSRFIGDLGYAYSWGHTTLTLAAWDYYRLAGVSNGSSIPDTKENIFNSELRLARQLTSRFAIEPTVSFRQWNPGNIRGGRLYTFGANARFGISDQFSGVASARIGTGWVLDTQAGRSDVSATGLTLYIRYQR